MLLYIAEKPSTMLLVNQTVEEVMSREFKVHQSSRGALDLNCPVCGKPMRITKVGYGCSGYPDCRFFIGESAHKKLTETGKGSCEQRENRTD